MNQIIKAKQFSTKQYSNSNKNQSLNFLNTPNFWDCDGFSYILWQKYLDTKVITAKTFE